MQPSNTREAIHTTVESKRQCLVGLSDYLFDNPELGNQEFKAHAAITKLLRENGFEVDEQVIGLETAFRATFTSGTGGPRIGILCEYDALKSMGHACGHHMQGPSILAAAKALKDAEIREPYVITVYGTPAEESVSAVSLPSGESSL